MMRYSIIGTGRLATWICDRLKKSDLCQVISSSQNTDFINRHGGILCTSLKELDTNINFLFVAVPDDLITHQFEHLPAGNYTAIHCSGVLPIPLPSRIQKQGNIWPVYSLHDVREEDVPIVTYTHGITEHDEWNTLLHLLSSKQYFLEADQKAKAHLIATIGNNFSNAIFSLCYDLSRKYEIPFDLFLPLLKNTGSRLNNADPFSMQTGPAMRSDHETMNKHLAMLNQDQKEIYNLLSLYIRNKKDSKH